MKKIISGFLIVLLIATAFACRGPGPVQPSGSAKELTGEKLTDSSFIKWQGRTYYDTEKGAVFFYNTASGFEINFYGTRLSATFTTSNTSDKNSYTQLGVCVDGEVFPSGKVIQLSSASSDITLATNLDERKHTVCVLKRSEPQDSVNSVVKIKTDGYIMPPPPASNVKMLLIGGSGISGHGALGSPGEARTSQNSSSLHAFGYLTARMFDADVQFVSNSGWGVLYGSNPTNNNGKVNLRTALDSIGIDDKENVLDKAYDLSTFIPDVVIVNAGGNDFTGHINSLSGTAKTNAQNAFSESVAEMCIYLKSKYPDCIIIWTYTNAETTVKSANGTYADIGIDTVPGNKNFIYSAFIAQVGGYGEPAGANAHAGIKTHIRNADIMADIIISNTNLKKMRDNII